MSQIHGFAAQTGGRAEIRSEPGEGTRLRIILPRSHRRPSAAVERDEAPACCEGLRVMLVEDNDQVRQFAEGLLGELHCRVVSAASGEEALERLEREQVDLLFSDVVMPGISGVELANRVRARHPDLPVLLASGYSEEVLSGAARDYVLVPKPYGLSSLNRALGEAVAAGTGQSPEPISQ